MNIMVTGGAGYIGSHTCKKLFKAGYKPIVLDDLSTGHESFVKWGPFEKGDINDYKNNLRIIKKYNIVAVIHFAAKAYVGESIIDPQKYFKNNVVGSLALLQAILDSNINTIINSSTCAIYGIPDIIPIPESHKKSPINPYGDSKLFIEKIIHWYSQAYGLKYVNLRYFNAAGADIELEIGELHHPETHLIPRIFQEGVRKGGKLEVFGSDYSTTDGTAIRDYIHVNDLAEAHVKSIDYLINGSKSLSLNLGTGQGTSIYEIIESVEGHYW